MCRCPLGTDRVEALVLTSGGLDSAVALAWAVDEGYDVRALTFDYHLRPDAERRAVDAQLSALDLPDARTVDLPWLREVEDVPDDARPAVLDDAPGSYVPARNAIFYAIAVHHAELAGLDAVVGGHNGGDGDDFPDARAAWFADLEDLLNRGLHSVAGADRKGIRIRLPLKDRSKADVVRLGADLGVPFASTWSCAYDGDRHCGTCSSCRERHAAFEEAGVDDPVAYATTPAAEVPP